MIRTQGLGNAFGVSFCNDIMIMRHLGFGKGSVINGRLLFYLYSVAHLFCYGK